MKRLEHLLIILFLSLSVYHASSKLSLEKAEEPKASLNFQMLQSCEMHGGVSCSKGKDTDGSVICADSYNSVPEKYENYCINSLPIINLVSVSEKLYDGSYMVMLRNNSSKDTGKVKLSYKNKEDNVFNLGSIASLAALEARAFKIDARFIKVAQKPAINDFIITLNSNVLNR